MFYKPTYCCHCGEKIERIDSLPWKTSGRFCDVCSKEFSFQEWFPKGVLIIFALFGLFGFGSYLKKGESANAVALKQNKLPALENAVKTENKDNAPQNQKTQTVQKNEQIDETNLNTNAGKVSVRQGQAETGSAEIEKVYYCGAATKKGTPCSRKVKGGGRCWQHKGQEAMFPPEKLLITQ